MQALQEQTSAPALVSILRAVRTVGKWLHEAPVGGNLEAIAQQPTAGPLLEAVLAKAAALPSSAAPALRLGCLLALVWLAPSPTTASDDGGEVWASLEAQVVNATAHLTDRQIAVVLTELLSRFNASPTGPARVVLARTILRLTRALLAALPSEEMAKATLQSWRDLWAAADAETRERATSAPYSLASGAAGPLLGGGGDGRPTVSRELFASVLAVLDDIVMAPGPGASSQRHVPRRSPRAWQVQGCTGPPAAGEVRAIRLGFFRLALRLLGQWAAEADAAFALAVLLRLQTSALHGDGLTRRAALGSLCTLAVRTTSQDVQLVAYDFLSCNDNHGGGGAPPIGDPKLRALARQRAEAAWFDAETGGGGLLRDGFWAATLAHLEEALERGGATQSAPPSAVGLSLPGLEAQAGWAAATSETVPAGLLAME
jgi:hypothetical protein